MDIVSPRRLDEDVSTSDASVTIGGEARHRPYRAVGRRHSKLIFTRGRRSHATFGDVATVRSETLAGSERPPWVARAAFRGERFTNGVHPPRIVGLATTVSHSGVATRRPRRSPGAASHRSPSCRGPPSPRNPAIAGPLQGQEDIAYIDSGAAPTEARVPRRAFGERA